jgi:hypothetical protein
VAKISNKINFWGNRWLSLAGRYILVKSVLEGQTVYWMSLEALPCSVLNKIRKLIFDFLWNGHQNRQRIHLCSWEFVKTQKEWRLGRSRFKKFQSGIKLSDSWRVLTVESLWHFVVRDKYLKNSSTYPMAKKTSHKDGSASRIWSSLLRTLPIILHWITWLPGSGNHIKIGCDRILRYG